jgi:ribosomal protein S8
MTTKTQKNTEVINAMPDTSTEAEEVQSMKINSTTLLSIETVENIRVEIAKQLLKRGFTASITLGGVKQGRENELRLKLTSEPFNTVPVIMEEIKISDFGSGIYADKDDPSWLHVWVRVSVAYKHFDGGTNGTSLFNFSVKIHETRPDLFMIQIGN